MTAPSNKSILISLPESLMTSKDSLEFLTLPHPKSTIPTYFLASNSDQTDSNQPQSANPQGQGQRDQNQDQDQSRSEHLEREKQCDQILELKVIRPEKSQRSWFVSTPRQEKLGSNSINHQEKEEKNGTQTRDADVGCVVGDGALHTLSPIDPIFLLLALFKPSKESESTRFVPSEDFFEEASSNLYRSRIRLQNQRRRDVIETQRMPSLVSSTIKPPEDQEEEDEEEGSWEDIIRFGNTKAAVDALGRISDTQNLTTTLQVYRPSTSKVLAILNSKLDELSSKELFEDSPNTLDRLLARTTDEGADEATLSKARRRIAKQVLSEYLGKEWLELLSD